MAQIFGQQTFSDPVMGARKAGLFGGTAPQQTMAPSMPSGVSPDLWSYLQSDPAYAGLMDKLTNAPAPSPIAGAPDGFTMNALGLPSTFDPYEIGPRDSGITVMGAGNDGQGISGYGAIDLNPSGSPYAGSYSNKQTDISQAGKQGPMHANFNNVPMPSLNYGYDPNQVVAAPPQGLLPMDGGSIAKTGSPSTFSPSALLNGGLTVGGLLAPPGAGIVAGALKGLLQGRDQANTNGMGTAGSIAMGPGIGERFGSWLGNQFHTPAASANAPQDPMTMQILNSYYGRKQ